MSAEEFSSWVTGVVLILGVIGASWKWFFQEALRRRTDFPSLYGSISAKAIHSDPDIVEIQVITIWENPSKRKIFLDTKESKIYLYELSEQFPVGSVDLGNKNTRFIFEYSPYQYSDLVFYEPGTRSEFSAIFRVPGGRSYAARSFLVMDENRMGMKNVWFRDIVISTSKVSGEA